MPHPLLTPDLSARVADALGDPFALVLDARETLAMPPPAPGAPSWPVPSIAARAVTSDGTRVTVVLDRR